MSIGYDVKSVIVLHDIMLVTILRCLPITYVTGICDITPCRSHQQAQAGCLVGIGILRAIMHRSGAVGSSVQIDEIIEEVKDFTHQYHPAMSNDWTRSTVFESIKKPSEVLKTTDDHTRLIKEFVGSMSAHMTPEDKVIQVLKLAGERFQDSLQPIGIPQHACDQDVPHDGAAHHQSLRDLTDDERRGVHSHQSYVIRGHDGWTLTSRRKIQRHSQR